MAHPHPALVRVLRQTADRLRSGSSYRWSNFGMCNCGHLAQTVTRRSPQEIHEAAMVRPGDWGEQARDYCGTTGLEMDHIIEQLLAIGLTQQDLHDLERLGNTDVLRRMDPAWQKVRHHSREYVVRYFDAWADLLEDSLPAPSAMAAK